MARVVVRQRGALLYYILLGIHIQNMVVLDVGRGSPSRVSHFTFDFFVTDLDGRAIKGNVGLGFHVKRVNEAFDIPFFIF